MKITDVSFPAGMLRVTFSNGNKIEIPLTYRLKHATDEQRADFRILGKGHYIHWDEIDEDIQIVRRGE